MQKPLYRSAVLAGLMLFSLAIVTPGLVLAQSDRGREAQQRAQERRDTMTTQAAPETDRKEAIEGRKLEAREMAAEKKAVGQGRLETAKLQVCKNRETAVKNIMSRMSDRGTKQLDVFTKISERTQAFYEEKGNQLANYDALIAELEQKKAAAELAVEALKNGSTEFNCDGEDPKGTAAVFKELMKAQNAALKEYKTSVKNLIVGVKSVQQTETDTAQEGTETPETDGTNGGEQE